MGTCFVLAVSKAFSGPGSAHAAASHLAVGHVKNYRLRIRVTPPTRFFRPPSSHSRQSLAKYLFPRTLRERYRERLLGFHLNTLPHYKHRFQSRIYRYILDYQRRRREQSRFIDYARRLLLGPPASRHSKDEIPTFARKVNFITSMSSSSSGVGAGGISGANGGRERGARRRKLAAMAESVYRAGTMAVNEIKESYNQTRSSEIDTAEISRISIPGSFPDVAIITKGNEQMVLFPSYAKRRAKKPAPQFVPPSELPPPSVSLNDQAYWRQELARQQDEKAIVDVDVRGWIYNPHTGPMTRRNRVLIGLARQLSGIPAPRAQRLDNPVNADPAFSSLHEQHEEERERLSIAHEAQEIERKGQAKGEAAQQGDYSERPKDESSEDEGEKWTRRSSRSATPRTRPASPQQPGPPPPPTRTNTSGGSVLSDAELTAANANLMARIGPFITAPLVEVPITLFFYNDTQAQSRTVITDDSGHFSMRAGLDFIPTNVRILANEDLSCTESIRLIEPRGVSLISDVDDTIKRSNISLGAKEIFRNTFVRELKDLTIDGVRDWYTGLHDMGVSIHYCSNSPWQLYPVLATFLKMAGLPMGSVHLKKYSGMLQGIFEPVAERKKGTLEKIMHDFPERKFLLVGDSGEADLEVYTELAVAYPGRIKAIFIRDVTTPEQPGFFDAAYDIGESRDKSRAEVNYQSQKPRRKSIDELPVPRPLLPAHIVVSSKNEGPTTDDLIDLSDPPTSAPNQSGSVKPNPRAAAKPGAQATNAPGRIPPPKPAKPAALQGAAATASATSLINVVGASNQKLPPAPPPPRRSFPGLESSTKVLPLHPLPHNPNSSELSVENTSSTPSEATHPAKSPDDSSTIDVLPPPPRLPRSSTFASITTPSPRLIGRRRTGDAEVSINYRPGANNVGSATPPSGSISPNQAPLNKKLELWRRRLDRAQATLDRHGVALYTWRRGEDVIVEAKAIVREAMGES